MQAVTGATVTNASSADLSTVQGNASVLVLKKALDSQASSALQLIQALPQPQPATSGTLGTVINTYA